MARPLEFPDGVRLARADEIPGSKIAREHDWERIQSARIVSGFALGESGDSRFAFYAEANIDARAIWEVFCDLSRTLLPEAATLILSDLDTPPGVVGSTTTEKLLGVLEPHRYQLAHDGWLQFGLLDNGKDGITEVFVAPTKHFKVWLNDAAAFREVMRIHDVPEIERLEFIDQLPRITMPLPIDKVAFSNPSDLIVHLTAQFDPPTSQRA